MKARDKKKSIFFFDKRDYELIRIVDKVLSRARDIAYARRQYYGYFHPNGIKEMAESRSLRVAYAMVHLLTSLEIGGMDERLAALRLLRDEVLDTAEGSLPKNTARVLMQIMKELVRERDNFRRQLELAHDFRMTASGKPRVVRKQLRRYHLLEMPEEWNQLAFDDHVHDANTKGRKSSTHLVMDAWIKGIRRLRVIHYNYIEPRFAAELLEAAQIMGIDIRIGIEFFACYRNRYINLIWVPRGFPDAQAFLCFLEEPAVVDMMQKGREVSFHQQACVMQQLDTFNNIHLPKINEKFQIEAQPISTRNFLDFVGIGQKSIFHLEKFIHQEILKAFQLKAEKLREIYDTADIQERDRIEQWFIEINGLDIEEMIAGYLVPGDKTRTTDFLITGESCSIPDLLTAYPHDLLKQLARLQTGYRVTLKISNLEVEDVLELVYDCNGMISRLELFNLKDWASKEVTHLPEISRLQEAINQQNPITLKKQILDIIQKVEQQVKNEPEKQDQLQKLYTILHDITSLQIMYKDKPLKTRIGSDSTGRSQRYYGMGLVVVDTLPKRTQRQILKDIGSDRLLLPIRIAACKRCTFYPTEDYAHNMRGTNSHAVHTMSIFHAGYIKNIEWVVPGNATRMSDIGNVVTLGGRQEHVSNGIFLRHEHDGNESQNPSWAYLNSSFRNILKIIAGFVPAFATFALTKDWWFLAYLGAFIWFGITGIRNILQSVLGGGGFRRSPLIRWNAYVSWDRIADSLLFTGFSVPLLDYLVKTLVLERIFGVTTATHPVILYAVMALINGLYLSGHNAFRGLPKGAVYGNFFRSVLSIPIAIAINFAVQAVLLSFGVASVNNVLQKWAAIISKTASDTVAAVIEGAADRYTNVRTRKRDYRRKFSDLFEIFAQLELLFPEKYPLEILNSRKKIKAKNLEVAAYEKIICIHALDALYFWMYQPRSQSVLKQLLGSMPEEERQIWVSSQFILMRQRDISQMFIDGVLGDDFARALSFYLTYSPDYLKKMKRFV